VKDKLNLVVGHMTMVCQGGIKRVHTLMSPFVRTIGGISRQSVFHMGNYLNRFCSNSCRVEINYASNIYRTREFLSMMNWVS
jgi:hypothetical protein